MLTSTLVACNNGSEENEGASNNPFYVNYKDVKIELNKKAESVLDKLGEPKYSDNLGDCGGIGVQMKYTYDNITLNTLKEKDGEVIHKIGFLNDLVSTPKGITIGSSADDVRAAYGTPSSEENGKLTYKSGDLELEFTVKNGSVSAVNYRRIR
jgi:ribosomal protein S16